MPGFADVHSRVARRAARWAAPDRSAPARWLETAVEDVARRLDPDRLAALATAVYAEKALSGVTTVGEFHHLHHDVEGRPFSFPNAMSRALGRAGTDAGVRLTIIDTLHLSGGLGPQGHRRPDALQRRYDDGTVGEWTRRLSRHIETDRLRVALGVHSVATVPRSRLLEVREAAADNRHARARGRALPVHALVCADRMEVAACQTYYGRSPVELFHDAGLLGPSFTAVHAAHPAGRDIALLGRGHATVALCPAPGEPGVACAPPRELLDAGARLAIGSDGNAVADPLAQLRALVDRDEGLGPEELRSLAGGHACLGWDDVGPLRVGARADLVCVRLDGDGAAGADPADVLRRADRADVRDVAVDGAFVVEDGRHILGDVRRLLREAIAPLREPASGA